MTETLVQWNKLQGSVVVSKTSNYTAISNDHTILCDAALGDITIQLPTATGKLGKEFTIIRIDAATNQKVIIDPNSTETINGNTTYNLRTYWHSITIRSDNSNWIIVNSSPTSFTNTNLIKNGLFESWPYGISSAPYEWILSGAGAVVARSSTKKIGSYAAQITYGSAIATLEQSLIDYEFYRGKKVVFSALVKCSSANRARIYIFDSAFLYFSSFHTGGGDWELLTVTRTIDAAATFIKAVCRVEGAGNAIFDAAKLEEGLINTSFRPHVIDHHYGGLGGTIPSLANDATPSVSGSDIWLTGGTTTITNFDEGIEGNIIRIIAEHSITITDGTNIFLNGSTNFSMTATDTLTLIQKADGKWYELSRGNNGA